MSTREENRQRLMKYGGDRYRHMLDLDEKYPSLDMFGPHSSGAEIRPGWVRLLEPCLEVLVRHGCRINQIKQKFCELVVYWEGPSWLGPARQKWYASGKVGPDPMDLFKEVKLVLDLMAHRSLFACEQCGEKAKHTGTPRGGTRLCEKCEGERAL